MAFDFNIDTFTEKLAHGGALNSLFQCNLTKAQGSGSNIKDFVFMCHTANLPASTIDVATINYMGRPLSIPGNRAVQTLTTSVYNDENMEVRNHMESWMEEISSHASNKRAIGKDTINSYTGTLTVEQLSRDGTSATKKYEVIQAWPSATGDIAVSWATTEIETFDITWNFAYWKASQVGKVITGGP